MKTDNRDLGKYDLNKIFRNPMLIHRIQDKLRELKCETFLGTVIKEGAKTDIKGTIKLIVDYYYDNPRIIKETVGKDTLELIEEFIGVPFADDLKDIPVFTQQINEIT